MIGRKICFLPIPLYLAVSIVLAGCATTQSVPYASGGLRLAKSLSEQKIEKDLTIRMNEDLLKLVVSVKPVKIPGTMSYEFYVGESIRSNIVNTLNPLFRSVNVSSLPLNELTKRGLVLDVDLKSYDFNLAASIMSPHNVRLTMEYKGYEEDGKNTFSLLTETAGASNEAFASSIGKTLDDWGRFPIEPPSAAPYVGDMSNAYDLALSRSLEKLLPRVNEAWIRPPQGK